MSSWPFRNVVIRLRSDLSVAWRKPLPLHVLPPALAAPKVTASGNLVVPGDQVFVLGSDGSVRAQTDLPGCRWLHTVSPDPRIRFACARVKPPAMSTIFEFDEALRIVSKIALPGGDAGIPAVSELSNGEFALLGNDGSKGPFLALYDARGASGATYRFPRGETDVASGIDTVPDPLSGVVVLLTTDRNKSVVSVATWFKTLR